MTQPVSDLTTCGGHGGRTDDGQPCNRPAGWGTSGDGLCRDHSSRQGRVVGTIDDGELPEPPAHLSDAASDRWRALHREWLFAEHELLLLEEALSAWDRVRHCRETLQREGYTVVNPDSGNPKPNPASRELDKSLTQLRQCLRQLDLEPPEEP